MVTVLIPKSWNMIKAKSISFLKIQDHILKTKKSHSLVLHQMKTFEGVAFSMNECAVREEEQRAPVPVLLPLLHQYA